MSGTPGNFENSKKDLKPEAYLDLCGALAVALLGRLPILRLHLDSDSNRILNSVKSKLKDLTESRTESIRKKSTHKTQTFLYPHIHIHTPAALPAAPVGRRFWPLPLRLPSGPRRAPSVRHRRWRHTLLRNHIFYRHTDPFIICPRDLLTHANTQETVYRTSPQTNTNPSSFKPAFKKGNRNPPWLRGVFL